MSLWQDVGSVLHHCFKYFSLGCAHTARYTKLRVKTLTASEPEFCFEMVEGPIYVLSIEIQGRSSFFLCLVLFPCIERWLAPMSSSTVHRQHAKTPRKQHTRPAHVRTGVRYAAGSASRAHRTADPTSDYVLYDTQ